MKKMPVIFLDRDGVLTKEKGYVTSLEQLEIFPYARQAVQILQALGYKVIVITNQSAVARGLMSEVELKKIHDYLQKETGVEAIYYCPHYPPINKEVLPYQVQCQCRKPNIELLQHAITEHNLTTEYGFFVGDRGTDILTGQKMHLKTVLLESGYGSCELEEEVTPDYIFNDLIEFAYVIKGSSTKCI